MRKTVPVMALAIAMTAPPALATGPSSGSFDELHSALSGGTTKLNLRYRYEDIDASPGFQGNASTLRPELSYETGSYRNLRAFLEFEATVNVLDHVNGSPLGIGDPSGGSVNQFYLNYDGVDNLAINAGRREIVLDNERFVGDVDWRQNNQALDGISFQYTGIENLVATYVYVTSQSTTLGTDISHDGTHLLNASYDLQDIGRVTGYYYRVEYDGTAFAMLSSDTMGLRFAGDVDLGGAGVNYAVEWATQDDQGNNPNNYSETYFNVEGGVTVSDINFGLQWERMGGSKHNGTPDGEFRTPLADTHVHNGLADVFAGGSLTGSGLEDLNLSVSGENSGIGWEASFHFFDANKKYFTALPAVRDEYGEELDLEVSYALNDQVDVGLMFANFVGFNAYADVSKFAVWMSYRIL